jgi:GTP cyclohydrolase II
MSRWTRALLLPPSANCPHITVRFGSDGSVSVRSLCPTEIIAFSALSVAGTFEMRVYRDTDYASEVVALVARVRHGASRISPTVSGRADSNTDSSAPEKHVLVRVHDQCATSEIFGSLKCDCRLQLNAALRRMNSAAAAAYEAALTEREADLSRVVGVFIFLPQEGRGIGLAAKVAAYALQEDHAEPDGGAGGAQHRGLDTVDANRALGLPDDSRHYGAVPRVLADLGLIRSTLTPGAPWSLAAAVAGLALLTNNPRKLENIDALGVPFAARLPCLVPVTSPHASDYLRSKSRRMGHAIPDEYFAPATTPASPQAEGADVSRGLDLIESRISSIPRILTEMAAGPLPAISEKTASATRFLVTGTGSSEPHARFLVWLISQFTQPDVSARFVPLTAFITNTVPRDPKATLVVISQGLSPNAQIALRFAAEFEHSVVFTSTSAEDEVAAGRQERAVLLRELAERGAEFVRFPLLSENSTLIRVIGPSAGFLAAHQFVVALSAEIKRVRAEPASDNASRSLLNRIPVADVFALSTLTAPRQIVERMRANANAFQDGFCIIAAAPLVEFAHNLAYKFMEGLFWRCPHIVELISFAHGPFQQLSLRPQPIIILQSSSLASQVNTNLSHAALR